MNELQSLFERIQKEIEAQVSFAEENNKKAREISEMEVRVKDKQKKVDEKESENTKKEGLVKAEREYLDKKTEELNAKELLFTTLQKERGELVIKKQEQEALQKDTLEKLNKLQELSKDLSNREILLGKERDILREKMEIIKVKEIQITKTQERLQRIADLQG